MNTELLNGEFVYSCTRTCTNNPKWSLVDVMPEWW